VVRVMVDGPSTDSPLVLQGRLEGQAPDIDSVVYLSECDASAIAPGRMIEARITGGRDYDLVAAVVGDPEGVCYTVEWS
jgi:ribosomal protein S12 methylthiotransferase